MTFRHKVTKETAMERFERQAKAQRAFYDSLSARTQVARDLIAKEKEALAPLQMKPFTVDLPYHRDTSSQEHKEPGT